MPSSQEILDGLRVAANGAIGIAIAWHALTFAAALALVLKWRPSRRMAGALLAGPIASASIVALAYDNPFNGVLLGGLALGLVGSASHLDSHRVRRGGTAAAIMGVVMIGFGWLYPHFLESRPATAYLFAAGTGVVPCPTLSLVIGFALLGGGLGSKRWSLMLAAAGLFYGLFGGLHLGVRLDIVLVAGAAALFTTALRLRTIVPREAAARGQAEVSSIHARPSVPPPIR